MATRVRASEGNWNRGDHASGRDELNSRRMCAWDHVITLALLIIVANSIGSAGAAAYSQRLSQYSHTVWRVQDGLFNRPNAIAQSNDGYLWLGTMAGLVRFDGVQFVPRNEYGKTSIAENNIYAVASAVDGSIWIGGNSSVSQIQGDAFKRYASDGRADILKAEKSGALWVFATHLQQDAGPVARIADGAMRRFGQLGDPLTTVGAVLEVGADHFWLGNSGGLCDWTPASPPRCFLQDKLAPFSGLVGITAIQRTANDTLLVGIARSGPGLGLGSLVNGQWEPFDLPGMRGDSLEVSAIVEDRAGSLWIGTSNKGLFRIRDGAAEHFGREDGLSDNEIVERGIFEDRDGNVWILTASGLDRFHERAVSVFSTREGLPANSVESVLADRTGRVWLGSSTLAVIENGIPKSPPHPEFYAGKSVTSMLEDRTSRMWIGLDRTLIAVREDQMTVITGADGADLGIVARMIEDVDGDIWVIVVGKPRKLVRIHSMKVIDEVNVERSDGASSLYPNPKGGVFVGFGNGDITTYATDGSRLTNAHKEIGSIRDMAFDPDGKFMVVSKTGLHVQIERSDPSFTRVPGLRCSGLLSILWDSSSRVWVNSSCGVFKIDGADWAKWILRPEDDIHSILFDISDGAESGPASFTPKSSASPDGTVWFATSNVAEMIDPARAGGAAVQPDVKIEEISADAVKRTAVDGIELPPASRNIDIRYTALVFSSPQKTKFRYRLEGRDDAWQDAGTRRQAFYTDLPPAKYTFLAQASSASGAWGEQSTALKFEVLPAYYQTRWFLILCGLGFVGLLYLSYVLRLRQVADDLKRRLKVKSDERERIARDLHDTLLQDTQALVFAFQSVADELPSGTPVRERMEGALDRADRVLAGGRECVLDLRTEDAQPTDLPDALAQVGDELSKGRSQTFRSIIEGTPQPLDPIVRDEVYRIAREAMVNAFRHGEASAVELQLIFAPEVFTVQIRDDGKGIDQATLLAGGREGHWGLRGMRERAGRIGGRLEIWSGATPGTEVQLEIPAQSAYRSLSAAGWSWIARLGIGGR